MTSCPDHGMGYEGDHGIGCGCEAAACHYCGTTEQLRPYGPGGAPLCFPCMKATPERDKAAGDAFGAIINANEAISPVGATLLTETGIGPLVPDELPPAMLTAIEDALGASIPPTPDEDTK